MAALKADFVNPFIHATCEAFERMVNMPVKRQRIYVSEENICLGEVCGVMRISGAVSGNVAVCLPSDLATKVYAAMTEAHPPDEADHKTCDAVGELVNLISGGAKNRLSNTAYTFDIGLPEVRRGEKQPLAPVSPSTHLVIVFAAADKEFNVQVSVD